MAEETGFAAGRLGDYVPAKDDRVSLPVSGERLLGTVLKGDRHQSTVLLDDGRRLTLLSSFLEPSEIPLPEHIRARTFVKGDRVEFDHWTGLRHGVVSRGGSVPRVYTDGRTDVFDISSGRLRHSDAPLRGDPPHPMDAWSVESYTSSAAFSVSSKAYMARIARDGIPIIQVIGSGQGEPTKYAVIGRDTDRSAIADLGTDATRWLMDHGMPGHLIQRPAEVWIEWKANEAPYGITASDLVERLTREMDAAPPAPQADAEPDMGPDWEFEPESYQLTP